MTLTRLLVAALVLCSVPALAQKQTASLSGPTQAADSTKSSEVAASETWRIVPNGSADASAGKNPLDRLRIGDYRVFKLKNDGSGRISRPDSDAGVLVSTLADQSEGGTTCYTIRSYVVARDEKGSDSTHPAGYSTCRPSDRYHVKSAEIRVTPSNQ